MSRKTLLTLVGSSCVLVAAGALAMGERLPDSSGEGLSRPVIALVQAGKMKDQYLVDVYATNADDLRSYQVAITTSGGTSGKLVLSGAIVNRQREDYVFGTANAITAESLHSARVSAVAFDTGVEVPDWAYLGTYVFRPTADAAGEFRIKVNVSHNETLLADSANEPIDFVAGPELVIQLDRRPSSRTTTFSKIGSK